MNYEILQYVGRFATPEVFTVIGALLTAWIGWKVTSKTIGLFGALAQKASFLGLTAAILFITGIGTTGLGIGELAARWGASPSKPDKLGMNDSMLTVLTEKCHDKEMAKLILDYTRLRDADPKAEEMRTVTQLIERNMGAGLGEKEREANARALSSFMDYLKVREENKSPQKGVMVASTSNDTSLLANIKSLPETNAPTTPVKENKDSLLTIPISLSLVGMGIGAAICGICCFNLRRRTV